MSDTISVPLGTLQMAISGLNLGIEYVAGGSNRDALRETRDEIQALLDKHPIHELKIPRNSDGDRKLIAEITGVKK